MGAAQSHKYDDLPKISLKQALRVPLSVAFVYDGPCFHLGEYKEPNTEYCSEISKFWNNPSTFKLASLKDAFIEIALHLDPYDICVLQRTCKQMKDIMSNEKIWSAIYFDYFITVPLISEKEPFSWRNLFIKRVKCIQITKSLLKCNPSNINFDEKLLGQLTQISGITEDPLTVYLLIIQAFINVRKSPFFPINEITPFIQQLFADRGHFPEEKIPIVYRESLRCQNPKDKSIHIANLATSIYLSIHTNSDEKTREKTSQTLLNWFQQEDICKEDTFTVENHIRNTRFKLVYTFK